MALVHLLVGLNGAGKSTLARSIAKRDGAVRDWNQWSRARRAQWRDAVLTAGHIPVLHHVRTGLEESVQRARVRAAHGDPESHPLDEAEQRRFATSFEPPGDADVEGMRVVVHG